MPLDPRVKDAIIDAVHECGQELPLAAKLDAWLLALAEGSESLENRDQVARHLELLFDATEVDAEDTEEP